jgi:Tol biopolymer transport system component/DNA-binding winged helix-turn-helix (wHTH) protein
VASPVLPSRMRFGEFEADLVAGELRKDGLSQKILLQEQSLAILRTLVARPGEMVSREELVQLLWKGNTNVDFDSSLNKAINRLRESLGDSAETPRYIETLSRRGYRFTGKIEVLPTTNGGTNPSRARGNFAAWTVVVSCALAAVLIYHRIRPPVDTPAMIPVPFTSYPGFEICPTFSPDGSQIAFAWNGGPESGSKGYDLYVKVIGSENLLRLTHHPSERICPAWSPDGKQIAFNRISGADTGLYVIPALGGPERKLRSIRIPVVGAAPISWSPDGKSIAFVDFLPPDDNFRINLLSVETLESKQISHSVECIDGSLPAFSHSGKQLAYVCLLNPTDKEFGIYTVPSSGGPPVLVTRFGTGWGQPYGIAWKADDKKLILSRPRFGFDSELDEVTLADGSLRKLSFGQDAHLPAISAKGDKLAFAAGSFYHVDIWRKDLSHPEAAAVKLISSTRSQVVPQYSPDGRHIAFTSNRGGPFEIWMSAADGTQLVRLSDARSSGAVYAHWSPDSQKIAFDTRQSGHPEVYVVDISERMPRRVVTNLPYMSIPSWSHDGKWLYFQSTTARAATNWKNELGERVFRCPASGGDAVALSAESGFVPLESHDGKTLYFAHPSEKSSIHMIPVQPAGMESVLRGISALDASEWTVVPRGIYFVPADSPRSVRYFDFATEQVRQIFEVEKNFEDSLSVSPDGRWMLYTQVDDYNLDIMLVDHFN